MTVAAASEDGPESVNGPLIVIAKLRLAVAPLRSVTVAFAVNGLGPLRAVGVPEIVPLDGLILSPGGKPSAYQLLFPLPPAAVSVTAW